MKLYQTIDGTMIGFYLERGGEIEAIMYRDVYERRLVTKTATKTTTTKDRYVNILMPARDEIKDVTYYVPEKTLTLFRIVPGAWGTETVYVPGYYETQTIWIPEHTENRLVEIPGHYEILPVWFEEYYITKYYWREAHPARGLEAAWIPYEELVPAGYSDTRVWVDTHWENISYTVPGEFRPHRVWVDGNFEDQSVWIPAHEEKYTEVVPAHNIIKTETVHWPSKYVEILIPGETTTKTITYQVFEEVWVGYEPVYSYVDEIRVTLFEVLDLVQNAGPGPEFEDVINIKNRLTGEESTTTAKYMGMATRIADNEYVVP